MASDISFALSNFEKEAQRQQAQERLWASEEASRNLLKERAELAIGFAARHHRCVALLCAPSMGANLWGESPLWENRIGLIESNINH